VSYRPVLGRQLRRPCSVARSLSRCHGLLQQWMAGIGAVSGRRTSWAVSLVICPLSLAKHVSQGLMTSDKGLSVYFPEDQLRRGTSRKALRRFSPVSNATVLGPFPMVLPFVVDRFLEHRVGRFPVVAGVYDPGPASQRPATTQTTARPHRGRLQYKAGYSGNWLTHPPKRSNTETFTCSTVHVTRTTLIDQ